MSLLQFSFELAYSIQIQNDYIIFFFTWRSINLRLNTQIFGKLKEQEKTDTPATFASWNNDKWEEKQCHCRWSHWITTKWKLGNDRKNQNQKNGKIIWFQLKLQQRMRDTFVWTLSFDDKIFSKRSLSKRTQIAKYKIEKETQNLFYRRLDSVVCTKRFCQKGKKEEKKGF